LVTNTWDAAGRWNTVGGTPGTFTYLYASGSASSLPIAVTLPGGGHVTNQYDSLARLTRTELRTSGGSILNAYGYQYNSAHQRTVIGRTNTALSSYNGYVLAEYDPASQLIKAWTYQPNGTPVTSQKWTYGYDPAQNLNKRMNNLAVETFTVDALNQLTSIPNSTPTYDRRGNLVSRTFSGDRSLEYDYDQECRLAGVQTDTSSTPEASRFRVEFVYDGQSRLRIKRDYIWSGSSTSGGQESAGELDSGGWMLSAEVRYVYDELLIVQERSSSNTPMVTYKRGRDLSGTLDGAGGIGGLLARSHGYSAGNWTYHNFYHADGNGNVTALVNSAGTLQASYIYDPYGRCLTGSGIIASANVMRFSSKPWVAFAGSTTSGLYYYGYRFYDPYLQRWMNRDPINEGVPTALLTEIPPPAGETDNSYLACRNDLVNKCDGDGRAVVAPVVVVVIADSLATEVAARRYCVCAFERGEERFIRSPVAVALHFSATALSIIATHRDGPGTVRLRLWKDERGDCHDQYVIICLGKGKAA